MAHEECCKTSCNHAEQFAEFFSCWYCLVEAAVCKTRDEPVVSEDSLFREGRDWKGDAHLDPFQQGYLNFEKSMFVCNKSASVLATAVWADAP